MIKFRVRNTTINRQSTAKTLSKVVCLAGDFNPYQSNKNSDKSWVLNPDNNWFLTFSDDENDVFIRFAVKPRAFRPRI